MEELKITRERAIKRMEWILKHEIYCSDKLSHAAINMAITALRSAAPENNVLTVEQLQEMGADMKNRPWVWIEVLKPFICESKISSYYQAQHDCTDGKAFCCGYRGMEYGFNYSDYGKSWLAYAHKPEGSEST